MRRWPIAGHCLLACFFLLTGTSVGAGETIEWSGYQWNVTSSNGRTQGPGPNIFSDAKENVFLDDEGNLHLRIVKAVGGKWHASQVTLAESLGYGTYQWEISSRYDGLPSNVVVGLFTYNSPHRVAKQTEGEVGNDKPDTAHEIDIEFTGAWGPGNLFFTTHDPDIQSPGVHFLTHPKSANTTHRFEWAPNKISWESFEGHASDTSASILPLTEQRPGKDNGNSVQFSYTGPVIPKDLDEVPMINFWIFGRKDEQPSLMGPTDGTPQELILRSFKFTPK